MLVKSHFESWVEFERLNTHRLLDVVLIYRNWTNLSPPPSHQFSPPTLFSGELESAVEVMEAVFTSPDSTSPSMSFVFRKILEDGNDKALDKCKTHTHTHTHTHIMHTCTQKEMRILRPQAKWLMCMLCCSECYGRAASQSFCLLQTSYRSLPPADGYGQSRGCQVHAGCEYECVCVCVCVCPNTVSQL